MELEIQPEPSPEERAALAEAVEALLAEPSDRSAWWREGIRESVLDGDG